MITKINQYVLFEKYILSLNKLDEGLIMTHDIYQSVKSLNQFLNISGHSVVNKNKIEIDLNDIEFNNILQLLTIINNLGYYISLLKITINDRPKTFTLNKVKDLNLFNEDSFNKFEYIKFILEPKFDIKHKIKTNILYHVTEQRYLDKIQSNGLIPKSFNSKTEHPERIYCVYDIIDAEHFIKSKTNHYLFNGINKSISKQDKYYDTKFVILKIELPINNDLIFYDDPNFKDKGIYTYDNINKNLISVYKIHDK